MPKTLKLHATIFVGSVSQALDWAKGIDDGWTIPTHAQIRQLPEPLADGVYLIADDNDSGIHGMHLAVNVIDDLALHVDSTDEVRAVLVQ